MEANRRPRLDRRNAIKNIDYVASSNSTSSSSLALDALSLCTSFRVQGKVGEFDIICRNLGLSPEDFAIPEDAWRSSKARDLTPRSRLKNAFLAPQGVDADEQPRDGGGLVARVDSIELPSGISILRGSSSYGFRGLEDRERFTTCRTRLKHEAAGSALDNSRPLGNNLCSKAPGDCENRKTDDAGGGIRGLRPPLLSPPPVMLRPVVDNVSSTWDLFKSFGPREGPDEDKDSPGRPSNKEDWVDGNGEKVSKERTLQGKDDSGSLSTSAEDEESENKYVVGNTLRANILEPVRNVSPNGSFRRRITSWQKGELLGSGSFGTVYEGFTDDGFFFAIKEVSLLDQGSQGKQSLLQLEQEISLLSQFEHENIVRYLGTDKIVTKHWLVVEEVLNTKVHLRKRNQLQGLVSGPLALDDEKLYIFLELMTKGSLAALYHKYNLRDSQVSAYTRQILNGLKYLHDQNVVHRDIKCANILVDASGSVKLADFGLAKATKMNDAKSSKGTAFWMAPEVVNLKNRSYGLAADIWSLGCTVLEMLTRRPPYSHLEGMQALFRIGKGEPPPVPDSLSRDARDLILRCLQVNPNNRPSAAQLLDHPFVRKPPTSAFASPRFNNIWS